MKIEQTCRKDHNVTGDMLDDFFNDVNKNHSESLKCYAKCLMVHEGHWKNGAFDANVYKEHMLVSIGFMVKQDDLIKSIDECKTIKGSNECDTAFMILKCLQRQINTRL